MLCGSAAVGVIAQATNLGVPYMLRALVLALTFGFAFALMRDIGFPPSLLLVLWGLMFAAITPVRGRRERATVLSFDSLLGSSGAVVAQPVLGRVADVWGYPSSYVCSAVIQALAIPFTWLARRESAASDAISDVPAPIARGRVK